MFRFYMNLAWPSRWGFLRPSKSHPGLSPSGSLRGSRDLPSLQKVDLIKSGDAVGVRHDVNTQSTKIPQCKSSDESSMNNMMIRRDSIFRKTYPDDCTIFTCGTTLFDEPDLYLISRLQASGFNCTFVITRE